MENKMYPGEEILMQNSNHDNGNPDNETDEGERNHLQTDDSPSMNMLRPEVKLSVDVESEEESHLALLYKPSETPPLCVALILGFQNAIWGVLAGLIPALIIGDLVCADITDPIRFRIFSSSVFMMGVTTMLQTAMGIRLPIFQGASGAFFSPLLTFRTSALWKCDVTSGNHSFLENSTIRDLEVFSDTKYERLQQIEGSLMLAACFEVIVGMTGLVGYLQKFVRPVSVAVIISLLGLGLYPFALEKCAAYWPVAVVSCVCMVVCSLYLSKYAIRVPSCRKKSSNIKNIKLPVFRSFPVLFACIIGTIICVTLTYTGKFSDKPSDLSYMARTDIKLGLIRKAPWIMFPYPFQFGMPAINAGLTIAFLASFLSSAIESLGDYMNLALICDLSPPPRHAVNRGILMEGLMAIISGSMGIGHATSSYSGNMALITITRVASRNVMVYGGAMLVFVSLLGKFGAAMTTLPDPALGGIFLFILGCLFSMGISSLQFAFQNPGRNLVIFGFSVYAALVIALWTKSYASTIKTGNLTLDGIIISLLGTPMLIGGVISVLLDNTVPGKKAEYTTHATKSHQEEISRQVEKQYKIPFIHKFLQRFSWTQRLPFL